MQINSNLQVSDVAGDPNIDTPANKMQVHLSSNQSSVKNLTWNRNYMNSGVGTTIIENEKGEE